MNLRDTLKRNRRRAKRYEAWENRTKGPAPTRAEIADMAEMARRMDRGYRPARRLPRGGPFARWRGHEWVSVCAFVEPGTP